MNVETEIIKKICSCPDCAKDSTWIGYFQPADVHIICSKECRKEVFKYEFRIED